MQAASGDGSSGETRVFGLLASTEQECSKLVTSLRALVASLDLGDLSSGGMDGLDSSGKFWKRTVEIQSNRRRMQQRLAAQADSKAQSSSTTVNPNGTDDQVSPLRKQTSVRTPSSHFDGDDGEAPPFDIVREVARSPFGTVYLARHAVSTAAQYLVLCLHHHNIPASSISSQQLFPPEDLRVITQNSQNMTDEPLLTTGGRAVQRWMRVIDHPLIAKQLSTSVDLVWIMLLDMSCSLRLFLFHAVPHLPIPCCMCIPRRWTVQSNPLPLPSTLHFRLFQLRSLLSYKCMNTSLRA